jgi:hypothetical protein
MATKQPTTVQTATTTAFTPIVGDAQHIPISGTNTQSAIDTLSQPGNFISADVGQKITVDAAGKLFCDYSTLFRSFVLKNNGTSTIDLALPAAGTQGSMEYRQIVHGPNSPSAFMPLPALPSGYDYKFTVTTHARFDMFASPTTTYPVRIYCEPYLDNVGLIDGDRMDTGITSPAGVVLDYEMNMISYYRGGATQTKPGMIVRAFIPVGTVTTDKIRITEWQDIVDVYVIKSANFVTTAISENFTN